ncbi:hypothetical protein LQF12_04765 [Ruania suaedae]|uniref:hypothetical protein n=1 Tax=Ruania suaedae TaxID=2897774 RepID=UPI001E44A667|nr:hypothetical protein [Ruania suaedae]UFU03924.1 hypothetical protein LQF12_04765 [Ruania suaedae]
MSPRSSRRSRRAAQLLTSEKLGLFGEVLTTSLWVAVLAIPLITALPALALGCAHLGRFIRGERDDLATLARDGLDALRRGLLWSVLLVIVAVGGYIGVASPAAELAPGSGPLRGLSVVLLVGIAVVVLRACAMWTRADSWKRLLERSVRRCLTDLRGSTLLLLAVVLAGVVAWMFAPLIVVVPGLLAFAAVAVELGYREEGPAGRP